MDRKRILEEICRDNGVLLAYLFGSRIKEGLKILEGDPAALDDPLADLDLGLLLDRPLPPPEEMPGLYAKLHNLLSDLFLPLTLDLVFLQEQHSVFQANAVTGACIYAADRRLKGGYEEEIMRRAADFRPFLERYLDEFIEGVTT